ncbi:MAG TPA: hypothetical protein VGR73_11475 [Bryobacteraceae bacterium]|nr:hypothetical protein [Bryobacteraceae bacterium]
MRLKILVYCFCSTAVALMAQSAAQTALDLAQPDAKILIGVDVRGLRNSSLADSLPAETRSQMQAPMAMFHVPGIELLDDIDSVFLSSTGDLSAASKPGTPKAGTVGAALATPQKTSAPFLLALLGTFPDEHVRPLLKGPHPSYKGINVYRGTGADPTSIAILDEHTVLMGDDKSIYRAIDRKTTGAPAEGPLIARARELSASNDIWIVARDASGNLQKASGPAAAFAAEIEGLDLGLAVHEGFNLDISLATKTEMGAQSLAQLLTAQMQIAVGSKMDAAKAADFWRKVKVGADGKRMHVQVALTKEELQENIRLMQQQRAAAQTSVASSAAPAAVRITTPGGTTPITVSQPPAISQPAGPPKPRSIKIYGLDDGIHEIKLDQNH